MEKSLEQIYKSLGANIPASQTRSEVLADKSFSMTLQDAVSSRARLSLDRNGHGSTSGHGTGTNKGGF